MVSKDYDLMTAHFTLLPKDPEFCGPPGDLARVSAAPYTSMCLRKPRMDPLLTARPLESMWEAATA